MTRERGAGVMLSKLIPEDDLTEMYADLLCRDSEWERSAEIIQDMFCSLSEIKLPEEEITTPKVYEALENLRDRSLEFELYELTSYIQTAMEYLEKKGKVKEVLREIAKYNSLIRGME